MSVWTVWTKWKLLFRGGGGDGLGCGSRNSQEMGNMADVANFDSEEIVVIYDVMVCERSVTVREIGFWSQNTEAYHQPQCLDFRNQSLGLCWQPSLVHHYQNLKHRNLWTLISIPNLPWNSGGHKRILNRAALLVHPTMPPSIRGCGQLSKTKQLFHSLNTWYWSLLNIHIGKLRFSAQLYIQWPLNFACCVIEIISEMTWFGITSSQFWPLVMSQEW